MSLLRIHYTNIYHTAKRSICFPSPSTSSASVSCTNSTSFIISYHKKNYIHNTLFTTHDTHTISRRSRHYTSTTTLSTTSIGTTGCNTTKYCQSQSIQLSGYYYVSRPRHRQHQQHQQQHFSTFSNNDKQKIIRNNIVIIPKKVKEKVNKVTTATVIAFVLGGMYYSIHTRKWREDHLIHVPPVDEHDFYFEGSTAATTTTTYNKKKEKKKKNLQRNLHVLNSIIERNGLMGKKHTVKEELDNIRSWHQQHGFNGGIVLRELNVPLFEHHQHEQYRENHHHHHHRPPKDIHKLTSKEDQYKDQNQVIQNDEDYHQDTFIKPHEIKQRECYYLYYEIKSNGETKHEIFCRGTTIYQDVITCLKSKLVYDEQLGIHVHSGFKDHANRLVKDVMPLLGPPYSQRSTVEVSGHSLGGAVAFLVAMKLKKMGYNVGKVTAIAGARFCDPNDIQVANALLPIDALRIEDDMDGVPFLPPWASGVGDKLWLVNKSYSSALQPSTPTIALYEPKYIPKEALLPDDNDNNNDSPDQQLSWVDDCWTNIRIPEILTVINTTHRITSHQNKIKKLILRMKEEKEEKNEQDEEIPSIRD